MGPFPLVTKIPLIVDPSPYSPPLLLLLLLLLEWYNEVSRESTVDVTFSWNDEAESLLHTRYFPPPPHGAVVNVISANRTFLFVFGLLFIYFRFFILSAPTLSFVIFLPRRGAAATAASHSLLALPS